MMSQKLKPIIIGGHVQDWSLKVKKKVTWVGPEGRNLKGGRCSEREVSLNLWPWPARFLAML